MIFFSLPLCARWVQLQRVRPGQLLQRRRVLCQPSRRLHLPVSAGLQGNSVRGEWVDSISCSLFSLNTWKQQESWVQLWKQITMRISIFKLQTRWKKLHVPSVSLINVKNTFAAGSDCFLSCADFSLSSPLFNETVFSYAVIPWPQSSRSYLSFIEFEVTFRPSTPDGTLLYSDDSASGDFLAINLVDRYVEFRFDCGSGGATIRLWKYIITNDSWSVMPTSFCYLLFN